MKGYIYAVAVGKDKTKIGFSMKPQKRAIIVSKELNCSDLSEVYISDECPIARVWESKIKVRLKDFICAYEKYPTETFSININQAINEILDCRPSESERSLAIESFEDLVSLSEFMLTDFGKELFVNSITISNLLGKHHRDVIRVMNSIEGLSKYKSNYTTQQNKVLPCYEVDRKGLFLLLMSFTGKNASTWKEWFISRCSIGFDPLGFPVGSDK